MKTLKQFLDEGRAPHGSSALLPSGSRLHPDQPHKNEYHAGWTSDPKHEGTYLLAKKPYSDKHVVISGHGSPDGYPNVGDVIRGHHDQTHKDLGHYVIVHKTTHKNVGSMPVKKSHPLWVYK